MRQLTHGPRHHFFGRAGRNPWNRSGTRIACLESAFHSRAPLPGERAQVGVVDPNTGGFSAIATTAAWSLPQGAMFEWSPQSPNEELLFNDMVDGSPVGVRLNVHTGARHLYIRPFAAAGGMGAHAASLSLGRIARLNPGEGAAGAPDHASDDPAPEDDGLFLVELTTGLQRLLLPIDAVAGAVRGQHPELKRREFWFEHVSFNPEGTRLLFTVFAGGGVAKADGALFTIGIDGAGLREVVPFGRGATIGAWLDAASCIATFRGGDGTMAPRVCSDSAAPGEAPWPGTGAMPVRAIPSPDGSLLAVESENPRRRSKTLAIVVRSTGEARPIGEFKFGDDAHFRGPARCDLNPRWNAGGNAICVDAIGPEGTRQLHVAASDATVNKRAR